MGRYWNGGGSPAYVNEWIANADGVTTFQVADRLTLRGTHCELRVDLSNYDLASGDTLILASYGKLILQDQDVPKEGWGSVTLTPGWSADLDLTYDIDGSGNLGIALPNIAKVLDPGIYVSIPEPRAYALLGALLALVYVMLRHRRR